MTLHNTNSVKKYKFAHLAIILLCLGSVSCEKFLTVTPPPYQPDTKTVFSSDQTAQSAVAALYNTLPSYMTYDNNVYAGLYADDLDNPTSFSDYQDFESGYLAPDNSIVDNYWQQIYNFIYNTNINLEGIQQSTTLSETVKSQLTGEVYFLRAAAYFTMVNCFGAVPLVTTTDYTVNASMARTDTGKVYDQIISDLTNAQQYLKAAYPSANRVRVNKWAAAALEARVYLYRKDWDNAFKQAAMVIDQGGYGALPIPEKAFYYNSPEIIFQIIPVNNDAPYNNDALNFIPGSSDVIPMLTLQQGLVNAFEPGDQRFVKWTGYNTVGGVNYYYPAKFKNADGSLTLEYLVFLRLSEVYLIRAEAGAHLNNLTAAIGDVDKIRARAGLPLIKDTDPTIGATDLLDRIYHEERIELFAEMGHRWLDLKRTGQAASVLGALKPGWKDAFLLWPIPETELESTPALTPNPGY